MPILLVPYLTEADSIHTGYKYISVVYGVENRYLTSKGEVRYAVCNEVDCHMSNEAAVKLGIEAARSIGSELSLAVRTGKGFHYYLNEWCNSFWESILRSQEFVEYMPAVCRDYGRVWAAHTAYFWWGWERAVLRVTATKYVIPRPFKIIYYLEPEDPDHRDYIVRVKKLYATSYLLPLL